MATKTMILRPTAIYDDSAINITFCPSDTEELDAYMLVNEAIADDDSTYIEVGSAFTGKAVICDFYKPGIITGIKLYIRAKPMKPDCTMIQSLAGYGSDGNQLITADSHEINCTTYDVWQDYVYDFGTESFLSDLNNLDVATIRIALMSGNGPAGSNGKTTYVNIRYTQVYLELTYEEPETTTTPIYLRENGTWNAVSGTIYRKENGAWVEADDTVFTQGDQFALNVIN